MVLFYYFEAFKGGSRELTSIVICLAAGLSVIAGFYATKIYELKSYNGKSLFFISIGFLFWFLGELFWTYYQLILKIDFPFPALPDFFYITAYPLIFIGIILKIKGSEIDIIKSRKKIFTFISIILFILSLFLIAWATFDSGLSFKESFFNFAYNIGDAILIILVFFIILLAAQYREGKLFWPWVIFIFALFAMFFGDILFFLFSTEYEKGDNLFYFITELSFVLSYILFAFSLFCIGLVTEEVRKDFLKKSKIN